MNIKLVVFDLAGTTIKDDGNVANAFSGAMKDFGYTVSNDIINPLMGYKKSEAIRILLEKYESKMELISNDYINVIHDAFIRRMGAYYNSTGIQILPNVEKVFKQLRSEGIQVGLNTGFPRVIADLIVGKLGWLASGLADYLIASDEVPEGRPAPYMIRRLMDAAGVDDPKQVVKIGDTEVDILEGLNAGCRWSIAVTTGTYDREELRKYNPSYIMDDMIDLLGIINGMDVKHLA